MELINLPAKNGKGEPNTIEITNKLLVKNEDTKLVIPADQFAYPRYETLQDAVQNAGSEDVLLEFVNAAAKEAALNAGKLKIRTATAGNREAGYSDVIALGITTAKEWTPAKVERASSKELADKAQALRAEIDNLSPEEMKARFLAMFK